MKIAPLCDRGDLETYYFWQPGVWISGARHIKNTVRRTVHWRPNAAMEQPFPGSLVFCLNLYQKCPRPGYV